MEGQTDMKTALQNVLMGRYNVDARYLDLQNLNGDEFLQASGLLAQESRRVKTFTALIVIAGQTITALETVNLASNGISQSNMSVVVALADSFAQLKNLSLADNNISQWRHLDPLRNKFGELRELVLIGNPITKLNNYRKEVLRRFPSLKILDNEQVAEAAPELSIRGSGKSALSAIRLPIATRPAFFETEDVQKIATDFFGKFLQVYDGDRAQLSPLYDGLSVFSMSLNTGVAKEWAATPPNFGAYTRLSRNQAIVKAPERQSRIALGQEQIMELLSKLPATRHDLASPEKLAIEAWTTRGVRVPDDYGIILVVHGEFEEVQASAKRSFDRTMFLLPSPALGSILVVSDMLTIRGYASNAAWSG